MLQYFQNFLIVSPLFDIYHFHKNEITKLQEFIDKQNLYYAFQKTFEKFIADMFQEISLRSKTVDFIKLYYLKMITMSYDLWLYPFLLNYTNIKNDLKVKTIQNFTKFIELIQNEIYKIENNDSWISIENDAKITAQQKICRSILLDELFIIYYTAAQTGGTSSVSSSSSQAPVLNTNSTINSLYHREELEKWKVEIIDICKEEKTLTEKSNHFYKQGHYDYLSKRFPTFSKNFSTSFHKNCKTHRAMLYFHKKPLYLNQYDDPYVESLPIVSVREFNEKKHLSINGDPHALFYDIYTEKNEISIENIRHIYVYGVCHKNNLKRFVGFAFENEDHFHKIISKKRFTNNFKKK